MNEQLALQNLLRAKFSESRAKNPGFSVRAFARKLGVQAGATNELLKGERRASRKLAERIARNLLLDPTERHELLRHFPEKPAKSETRNRSGVLDATGADTLRLSADQFHIIAEWTHFAILSLVRTHGFKASVKSIADRLGISQVRARSALDRLLRLGLLERAPGGRLVRSHARFATSDDVFNPSIQKAHLQDMELARESLARDPVGSRDFTSITLPVSPRLLPKAKEMIRRAQDEIAELLASEPATEVYRMSVYLFPLTRMRIL